MTKPLSKAPGAVRQRLVRWEKRLIRREFAVGHKLRLLERSRYAECEQCKKYAKELERPHYNPTALDGFRTEVTGIIVDIWTCVDDIDKRVDLVVAINSRLERKLEQAIDAKNKHLAARIEAETALHADDEDDEDKACK